MQKKWISRFWVAAVFISVTPSSFAFDIKGKGNLFIEVSKVSKDGQQNETGEYRLFKLCNSTEPQTSCEPLGDRIYRLSELANEHDRLISLAGASLAATISAVPIICFAVGMGWTMILAKEAAGYFLAGAGVGGAGMIATSRFSPWYLRARARLIRDEVIDDSAVFIDGSDEDMKQLAWDLDAVLKNLKEEHR